MRSFLVVGAEQIVAPPDAALRRVGKAPQQGGPELVVLPHQQLPFRDAGQRRQQYLTRRPGGDQEAVIAANAGAAESDTGAIICGDLSLFSESGDLVDINPIADHIPMPGALIYDTLLRRTAHGELEPRLASGWTATDPKTWRFTLRSGVRFHDGSPFDANDVATTMRYILDPARSSGYLRFIRSVTAVNVVDPSTVDFVSSVPNSLLPDYVNQKGRPYFPTYWWVVTWPSVALVLTVTLAGVAARRIGRVPNPLVNVT